MAPVLSSATFFGEGAPRGLTGRLKRYDDEIDRSRIFRVRITEQLTLFEVARLRASPGIARGAARRVPGMLL